jgi:DNA polymerase elongation subunit (family B)
MKLIELVRGICHIGHVQYEDYGFSSRFLEGTIVTYLHRKGLIVTDKQANARQMMNDRDGTDKFVGAYVKVPNPAKYDWVFSLDLQSLYPSIIMSLNISPETKVGRVVDWNNKSFAAGEMDKFSVETEGTVDLNREQFDSFITENNLAVSSNGILYQQDKRGIIPEILEQWFDQRIEFQKLMKKHGAEFFLSGNQHDKEMADFYDRRQHIQKIFLNSLYGVLGLPIFRFFDLDNAVAVTATGQDVIKNSAVFVNDLFEQLGAEPKSSAELAKYELALKQEAVKRKERFVTPSEKDWCIYIDTDSLYFSSLPLKHKLTGDLQTATIKLSRFVEQKLNEHYDEMAVDYFNCPNHRFHIKGETIARSGIWITKKRYAMLKVYDLEKNTEVDPKLIVKGLDIVRSTFPIVFKQYMRNFIISLLNDADKVEIDKIMVDFVNGLSKVAARLIARNTAAKNVTKYKTSSDRLGQYMKSAPMHVKSVINYNQLLKEFGIEKQFPPISDGEKIKYVMLRQNPYHIDTLAFKDYEDPPQIMKFLKTYCDHQRLFDAELKKKLQDFYNALGWGELPINIKVDRNILNMFGL